MKEWVISVATVSVIASLIFAVASNHVVKSQSNERNPHAVSTGIDFNGTPVIVKLKNGHAKAYVNQKFSDLVDIENYVAKRKQALAKLVEANPAREIEVVISPAQQLSLRNLKHSAGALRLKEIGLDLFVDDKWNRMVQFDETSHLIDISQDTDAIEQRVAELESMSTPSKPNNVTSETSALDENFRFGLRFARGVMSARAAATLQESGQILLVDPVTDVTDELERRFGNVTVVDVPQLFVIRETKFGQAYGLNRRDNQN